MLNDYLLFLVKQRGKENPKTTRNHEEKLQLKTPQQPVINKNPEHDQKYDNDYLRTIQTLPRCHGRNNSQMIPKSHIYK